MTAADAKQIELLRKATPQQRVAIALRLSDEVLALARRAIERAFPELDRRGQELKFVELHYGHELARRLAAWFDEREHGA